MAELELGYVAVDVGLELEDDAGFLILDGLHYSARAGGVGGAQGGHVGTDADACAGSAAGSDVWGADELEAFVLGEHGEQELQGAGVDLEEVTDRGGDAYLRSVFAVGEACNCPELAKVSEGIA